MTLALTHGTLIDGRGGEPQQGIPMLIEGERITSIGPNGHVRIPRDTTVIDAQGGIILPGLIDTHVHFMMEYPGENGRELQLMVENGMTPMQSILASTAHAAQLLHLNKQLGTLEEGKLADVIIVAGDVLSDISTIANPNNVKLVFKGGKAAKNILEAKVPMMAGKAKKMENENTFPIPHCQW